MIEGDRDNLARIARSFENRLRLNPEITKNAYWCYPVLDDGHGNFVQAGRGNVASDWCARPKCHRTCHEKEYHKGVVVNGNDFTDKVAVLMQHYWCHRFLCPKCFARGAAVRGARNAAARLLVASERGYGDVEHGVLSPPRAEWDLPFSLLCKKAQDVARDRGFLGGMFAFHGRRIDKKHHVLFWSPHFHYLGFVDGGFDVCRECVHSREDCSSCSHFKGREVRGYAKDGWLVKVEPKRKTIIGTIWYILTHISVKVGLRRSHSVRWFGCCGNRKFKGRKPEAVVKCPVCKVSGHDSEMTEEQYWGREHSARDISDPHYLKLFAAADFDSEGSPNFPSSAEDGGDLSG